MEETKNERVKRVRDHFRLSQAAFAERLGMKSSFISEVETGKKNPSARMIELMVEAFGISADWLYHGRGSMLQHTEVYEPDSPYVTQSPLQEILSELQALKEHLKVSQKSPFLGMIIAEKIKEAREAKGLAMEAVAQEMGWPDLVYANIENGTVIPTEEKLKELAKLLEIPMEALYPDRSIVNINNHGEMNENDQAVLSHSVHSFTFYTYPQEAMESLLTKLAELIDKLK